MRNIRVIGTALLIAIFSLAVNANEKFKTTLKEEFDIDKNATVRINNSFGDVQCYVWDDTKVDIEVIIEVWAKDEKEAEKMFDKITVDISGNRGLVEELTKVKNSKSKNAKFSINVNVHLPASVQLDLTNQFGNTFLGAMKGRADITQRFGTLQLDELQSDENEVVVQHGEFIADFINEAEMTIQHSEASIEKANFLNLDSDFTDLEIEKAGKINLTANFGRLEIEEVNILEGKSNGTRVTIDYLTDVLQINSNLGEISVDEVGRNFSEIDIDANHSSIELGLNEESNFSFEAKTQFAGMHYPSFLKLSKEKLGFSNYRYSGQNGSENSTALVKIKTNFGTIEIN
ncbi:MAG: hypothetical protein GY834_03640 [Bacteroidetes bacterium]|nr:hypothetical protein [Bacteroidota bacterium]